MLAKSTNLPETVTNLAEDLITVIKKHVKVLCKIVNSSLP